MNKDSKVSFRYIRHKIKVTQVKTKFKKHWVASQEHFFNVFIIGRLRYGSSLLHLDNSDYPLEIST